MYKDQATGYSNGLHLKSKFLVIKTVRQKMKTDTTSRQIQYLASVLALVSSYYAIRASVQLPKFHHLLLDSVWEKMGHFFGFGNGELYVR